jgi:uncharacterized membrane protein
MATFSGYLMWLLATKLGAACPFCLVSATLSFSMAYLTWTRNAVPVVTKATVRRRVRLAPLFWIEYWSLLP